MLACIYRNLIFNQGSQLYCKILIATCLQIWLKNKGDLLFIDMNYFAQVVGCAFITRAMHVRIWSSRLQLNPRSVLINSNRVDKRVFLSEQYATVRCANRQSGQLIDIYIYGPAANHSITQPAYASVGVILSITFHFQYSWLSMYYNICYVEDLHRCRLFDLFTRLNEYQ